MLWLAPAGVRGRPKTGGEPPKSPGTILLSVPSVFWDFGSLYQRRCGVISHALSRQPSFCPCRCSDFGFVSRHKPSRTSHYDVSATPDVEASCITPLSRQDCLFPPSTISLGYVVFDFCSEWIGSLCVLPYDGPPRCTSSDTVADHAGGHSSEFGTTIFLAGPALVEKTLQENKATCGSTYPLYASRSTFSGEESLPKRSTGNFPM